MNSNLGPQALGRKGKDPFIQKFEVESDKRLASFVSVFTILGVAILSYMATVEVVIPATLYTQKGEDNAVVTMKLNDVEKKKDDELQKKKAKALAKVRKKSGGGGKAHGRGNPNAPITQAALRLITSRSSSASLSSYDLLNQKFAKDIDKVINNVAGLTRTGETRLGGRRGKVDGAFNEGYAVGGSGGIDDMLGGLLGGDAGPVGTHAAGHLGVKAPEASDINMGQESGQRSTESILRVIRQHTPGLRHTYNKYLKLNPGFKGKVTMRFAIAPSGSIVELTIVGSTTGVGEFDDEIKDKIRTWKFEPIKGRGNDVVTVPFTFSE